MKSFNIDIEALESVAYAAGLATVTAQVTVTEVPDGLRSALHMSETSLRLLHKAVNKVVLELDAGALSCITRPSLAAPKKPPP